EGSSGLDADEIPWERTKYRWRTNLKNRVAYFPAFAIDELGLVHLHLFISEPNSAWFRFPYAVESQWVTQNLVEPVLYLHCCVPLAHRDRVDRLLRELDIPHKGIRTVWSSSAWQRLRLGA